MKLTVHPRQVTGKKVKTLRKNWQVPGVIYGKHLDSGITVSVDKVQLVKVYHKAGRSTPIELKGGDIDQLVLFHDLHLNPITDHVMHVDFLAVNKDEKVEAEVPLILVGESPVETDNLGRVQLLKNTVQVEALPLELPHDIKIDISQLKEVGDILFIKDIHLDGKVEILDDEELAIASAVAIKWESADADEAEEATEEAGEADAE